MLEKGLGLGGTLFGKQGFSISLPFIYCTVSRISWMFQYIPFCKGMVMSSLKILICKYLFLIKLVKGNLGKYAKIHIFRELWTSRKMQNIGRKNHPNLKQKLPTKACVYDEIKTGVFVVFVILMSLPIFQQQYLIEKSIRAVIFANLTF